MRCRSLNDILAIYHPLSLKPGRHDNKIKPKRDLQLFYTFLTVFLVVFDACYTKVTAGRPCFRRQVAAVFNCKEDELKVLKGLVEAAATTITAPGLPGLMWLM